VAHRGNPPSIVAPPIVLVLVLVLSEAVLVLVLETTFPVVAIDHREPPPVVASQLNQILWAVSSDWRRINSHGIASQFNPIENPPAFQSQRDVMQKPRMSIRGHNAERIHRVATRRHA
jgi:hypothetical protein